ncbi:MAG: metallophosphoesterase [Myxococcota bacterium]
MKLYAISDLHVGFPDNRAALDQVPPHPLDWLILAGDIGETEDHLAATLDALGPRFRQLIWCPGNHELWTTRLGEAAGQDKYERLVELCRERGVLTPEDDYPVWQGEGGPHLIAPMFLLYDYTFRPESIPVAEAVEWAAESGIRCADEDLLQPDPYPSRQAWCHARVAITEARLTAALSVHRCPSILINHFPLKRSLARLPAIPRFQIWCGTQLTENWHTRFRAAAVVTGHLHIRSTQWIDGVRFEEVSLGYPDRQWRRDRGIAGYLRPILPHPAGAQARLTAPGRTPL